MDVDRRLARTARSQHGLITRRQALEAGLSPAQLRVRLQRGYWRPVRTGVYAWAGAPASYEQAVHAAILAVDGFAVASHATAASLWSCWDRPKEGIELLLPLSTSVRRPGVIQHKTAVLPAGHRSKAGGVPVTSFARTLVDLSGRIDAPRLGELLDEGARRHLVTVAEFERCARRVGHGPGRDFNVIGEALGLRVPDAQPLESVLEARALRWLLANGFPPPIPQFVVAPYRIDLAYPEHGVGIEMLGFGPHSGRDAFDHDAQRGRFFALNGWVLLPFTSTSTERQFTADVDAALKQRLVPTGTEGLH
jgi:hypothetical protein